jgi:hypothetical protein
MRMLCEIPNQFPYIMCGKGRRRTSLEISVVSLNARVPAFAVVGHLWIGSIPEESDGRTLCKGDDGEE